MIFDLRMLPWPMTVLFPIDVKLTNHNHARYFLRKMHVVGGYNTISNRAVVTDSFSETSYLIGPSSPLKTVP